MLWLQAAEDKIFTWMHRQGHRLLRICIAIVFIWFGALKPLGVSPATDLVVATVRIFMPWFHPYLFVPFLGWWEVMIGVCFLFRPLIRWALVLFFLQMIGTILPLILLPDRCFAKFPFYLTMEGQYIIKNIVLISAAIVVGGTVKMEGQSDQKI